ncbi:hypothetical protein BC629DRAFT_1526328 [Irpex lacteus]|nr:hypothetical protein BC629DRAFT_1573055 [Irpex lacteus]KAI0776454.1 hypothetical protein BC629DRAFT_1526328 [Irpex lacteus]
MLLYTTRQDLSQIPRQHPQLLRVAHMSKNERNYIENKGIDMARAYRRNLGNLYPPGVEDNDGGGLLCTGTSAPPQDSQDPVLNGSGVDQEELSVSGGLQRELPTDTYDVSPSRSRSPSDSEVRITEATNQFLQTSPGQANNSQPGQSPPPMYEKTYMSEDKDPSQGEELDDSPKELTLAGDPAKLAKDPGHLAGAAVHQASKEGRATPGVSEGHTMPVSLPTSARNETVPAEVQDSLEVTANNTQAYPVSDRVASLLGDGAVVEDDSQHADNITTVAESAHTILRSSSARDEGYAHADVEAGTGDEEQMAKREVRAVD